MENRDFRGITSKHLLGEKVIGIINSEGFEGAYSLNDTQVAILTQAKENYEILVEKNVYMYLQEKGIVPKISWL